MDREPEELQYLGFFGVCCEAAKLIFSWRRLFGEIGAALIVPLAVVSLANIELSKLIFMQIGRNEDALDDAAVGSPAEKQILSRLASDWAAVVLFKAAYLLAVLVLSLLSTSAVVYTVASVYSAKDLAFRKVLSVVPKVWRRLIVTFLWAFLLLVACHAAAGVLILLTVLLLGFGNSAAAVVTVIGIMYLVVLVWVGVVWHVASVVSVLEDDGGLAAMKKGRRLVRGKLLMAAALFVIINVALVAAESGFRVLVVDGDRWPARIGYAVVLLLVLSVVILVGLVVQTVVYFVCKSYHHESIDKSSLADHLEVYLGEYVPLKGRDVQLEQYYV